MMKYIIVNIYQWHQNIPSVMITKTVTNHGITLYKAITEHTKLEWNLYLRGHHVKEWNEAYHTWYLERKSEILPHKWNHYAIGLIMDFSISIWVERCRLTHESFKAEKHGLLIKKD